MKSENGITLTTLVVYILVMTIAVSIVASLTTFFYKNVNVEDIESDTITQFTKFSSFFSKEINNSENYVIDCKTEGSLENNDKISYIIFSSGNQYTFKNNEIYKNNKKICKNIDDCDFSYVFEDSKYKITVNFISGNIDMTEDNAITYVL